MVGGFHGVIRLELELGHSQNKASYFIFTNETNKRALADLHLRSTNFCYKNDSNTESNKGVDVDYKA